MKLKSFYAQKRIFVTGHTGFKGTWLCNILIELGAIVCGYSLEASTKPNLFELLNLDMESVISDIRDYERLFEALNKFKPEIVFHLAAQPLVSDSYDRPRYTYETNVMGTVNLLDAIRDIESVKSVLNVTTDKVYKNNEWCYGYRENDQLDGFDPYSNSKSCSELVTATYKRSYFKDGISISTARAGNVIGGGDFSENRIIPDCVRSVTFGKAIVVRNPNSIRPYQHVLESLFAYITIAYKQYENIENSGSYNVGPSDSDCITTGNLVKKFCDMWGEPENYIFEKKMDKAFHEANFLKLDNSKINSKLNVVPIWNVDKALEKVIEFEKLRLSCGDIKELVKNQIHEFYCEVNKRCD